MTMAGSKNPKRFVSQLAVDQGSVGEYLLEEVIAHQPERIRRLLIETSVLDTTTGALAAAITGIAESGELLAELARSNSFVIPLDHTGTQYRYHPLLLEVLRYLLKREYRQTENDLRRRAARWYEEHGQPATAVRLALSAADWMCATHIIAHGGVSQAFLAGQDLAEFVLDDFSKFLSATTVPEQWQPEVELAWAVAALAHGEIDKARSHVAAARAAPLAPDVEESALLLALLAAQREAAVDEVDQLAGLLRTSATSNDARMAAALRLAQATARYWNDGRYSYSEVEALLTESVDLAIRSKSPEIELEALGFLKLTYAAVGRYEHLREVSGRSRNVFRVNPSVRLPAAHYLADAYTALMRMDTASTERALRKARQSPNFDAQPVLRMAVTLLNASTLMSSGQPAEAHQVLAASTNLDALVPERLTRRRDNLLADIAVRLGRPNAALRMLREDPTESNDPAVVAIGARAYIALGDGVAARRCLRPVLIEHERAMPLPLLIELLLVSAAVDDLSGDGAGAVGKVLRACDLARGRTVVPFNDMRGMLTGVLARHPEVRAAWPGPVDLPSPNGVHRRRAAIELVESLTDRELVVLRRLASTMTTQEIADELCVSVNTVKTHIAAIYRKLPAGGRHDAVARARQLELL
jgi:LuxR family maltose regulon positive regulatory protein